MVVSLHSTGPWMHHYAVDTINWVIGDLVNALCRVCVPFFLMLSGYLIGGRNQSLMVYAKKRIDRVLPAFLGATALALLYRAATGEQMQLVNLVSWLWTPQYFHLDFFYALAIIYTAFAFWRPAALNPIVGAAIALISVIAFGYIISSVVPFGGPSRVCYYLGYLSFAFGGYYAGQIRTKPSTARWLAAAGIACLIGTGAFVYRDSLRIGAIDETFYNYCSPLIALGSFLLFTSARHLFPNHAPSAVAKLLDRTSLTIYCVHPFILAALFKAVDVWRVTPILAIPAVVAFTVMLIVSLSSSR